MLPVIWENSVVWVTAKTLMAHKAWRHFPLLTKHLPHILLGGSLQGVDLHSAVFEEPTPKGKTAAGVSKTAAGVRTNLFLERRKQRFADVSNALESLIEWVKLERKNYQDRVMRTPASRRPLATRRVEEMKSEKDIHDAEHILECQQIRGRGVGHCPDPPDFPEPDADTTDSRQPLATGRCPVAQDIDTRGPNNAAPGANEDRCTQGLRRTRHDIDIDDVLHEEACLEKECVTFFLKDRADRAKQ